MDKIDFKKITAIGIFVTLLVLTFLLIKPILLSIVLGIILAFIFTPVYNWLNKKIKSENISAFLICLLLLILIILPLWFLTPLLVNQSIHLYLASQQMDFVKLVQGIFPSLFSSETFSAQIGTVIYSFVNKITHSLMDSVSNLILNFPTLFLQYIIVFFTFFFVLKDQTKFKNYIQSLLPFSNEIEEKLFKSSKGITASVLYGQVVMGVIQGIFVGLGFFIFKVPNALIFTFLAILVGIFPIIGTSIIWIPIMIYLFIAGNTFAAIGVLFFGVLSLIAENILKPIFISKRTNLNSLSILIGMIGGLFLFGIIGIILGPLILAYLFIILEIYRDKRIPGIFLEESKELEDSKKNSSKNF